MILTTVTAYLLSVHCNHNYTIWNPCRKGSCTGPCFTADSSILLCSPPTSFGKCWYNLSRKLLLLCSDRCIYLLIREVSQEVKNPVWNVWIWAESRNPGFACPGQGLSAMPLPWAALQLSPDRLQRWASLMPVKGGNLWICAFKRDNFGYPPVQDLLTG